MLNKTCILTYMDDSHFNFLLPLALSLFTFLGAIMMANFKKICRNIKHNRVRGVHGGEVQMRLGWHPQNLLLSTSLITTRLANGIPDSNT